MNITFISQYKNWMDHSIIISFSKLHIVKHIYLKENGPNIGGLSKKRLLINYVKATPKLFFNIKHLHNTVYITGLHFPFFLVSKLSKKINQNVIIDNFYIHALSLNKYFKMILKYLLKNKKYTLIVQSQQEVEYFSKISKSLNIIFIPYCMKKLSLPQNVELPIKLPEKYFFAGGGSNRDHEIIIKAAQSLPNLNFVLIISNINTIEAQIPQNLFLLKSVHPNIFNTILKKSYAVIIPLKQHVGSSGQMVCLTAMQFGKPIIYSENSSINHYFEKMDFRFPYEQGNLKSLIKEINKVSTLNNDQINILNKSSINIFNDNYSYDIRIKKISELLKERINEIQYF